MNNEKITETNNVAETETSKCLFCETVYNSFEGHLCEKPVGFRGIKIECGRCAELEADYSKLKRLSEQVVEIYQNHCQKLTNQNTALQSQLEEINMAWWRELCLIDGVAPEPKAVKAWILAERAEIERLKKQLATAQRKRIGKITGGGKG